MNQRLLQQEIWELTSLLRKAPRWKDLRSTLGTKQLQADDLLLVNFYEDDEANEYGLVLTADRRFVEYQRSTRLGARLIFSTWRERTAGPELRSDYPAIDGALALLESGGMA